MCALMHFILSLLNICNPAIDRRRSQRPYGDFPLSPPRWRYMHESKILTTERQIGVVVQ